MGAIPLWLQNITFSLLGGGITDTHHKNQGALGLRFRGEHTENPPSERTVSFTKPSLGQQFLSVKMTHCFGPSARRVPSQRHTAPKPCGTFWVSVIIRGLPNFDRKSRSKIFPLIYISHQNGFNFHLY